MHYYGVRYANECNPSDLWITYFTSSVHVTEYVKTHGAPDVKEVRRKFSDRAMARKWEYRVLTRLRAVKRKDYLNRHDGNDHFFTDWDDESIRLRHKKSLKDAWSNKELIEKFKIILSHPDVKKRQTDANREINRRPSVILKKRNIAKKMCENSNFVSKFSGMNHGSYDDIIYNFVHISGITENCTKSDLIKKYDLQKSHVYNIVNGDRISHKGWKVR